MAEAWSHSNCCGIRIVRTMNCATPELRADKLRKGVWVDDIWNAYWGWQAGMQYHYQCDHADRPVLEPVLKELGFRELATNSVFSLWGKIG